MMLHVFLEVISKKKNISITSSLSEAEVYDRINYADLKLYEENVNEDAQDMP